MELGWLLDAFHGRDLGEDFIKQPRAVEKLESVARAPFGQDADQLIAHAFGAKRCGWKR